MIVLFFLTKKVLHSAFITYVCELLYRLVWILIMLYIHRLSNMIKLWSHCISHYHTIDYKTKVMRRVEMGWLYSIVWCIGACLIWPWYLDDIFIYFYFEAENIKILLKFGPCSPWTLGDILTEFVMYLCVGRLQRVNHRNSEYSEPHCMKQLHNIMASWHFFDCWPFIIIWNCSCA